MKKKKEKVLEKGEQELEVLTAFDFNVIRFNQFHFRINNRLDIWPSTRKSYDIISKRRNTYTDLIKYVKTHFKHHV